MRSEYSHPILLIVPFGLFSCLKVVELAVFENYVRGVLRNVHLIGLMKNKKFAANFIYFLSINLMLIGIDFNSSPSLGN